MESIKGLFDEHDVLHKLKHYLPAQASLKDFVHHNTLHAFQHLKFHEALHQASQIFGYKTYLSLAEFRNLYQEGKIREDVLDRTIKQKKGESKFPEWKEKLLQHGYNAMAASRVGHLRAQWKANYMINLDKVVHPFLYRLLSAYLDQGISIWAFPIERKGFLTSLREIEQNEIVSIFKTSRPRNLLMEGQCTIKGLLQILVGEEALFEQYLFDQQFSHPGWSGIVSVIEQQPETLLDSKTITLHDLICLELLLEIDALDNKFGRDWQPLGTQVQSLEPLFQVEPFTELEEVLIMWQEAFEWSYYDDVLKSISLPSARESDHRKRFQALFCIDDREYSLRRYIERTDPDAETFGTPGFFGVEFFFQPEHSKFYTKACPAPVTPAHLIREEARRNSRQRDPHYTKRSHLPLQGWLITQTLGFWSALKLFLNIFKPSVTPATSYSFQHMDKHSRLSIEYKGEEVDGLKVGFTVEEMARRVGNTLRSIGLVKDFASIIYVVGHGASSVNNTHYAGYDCGACCGRPGAVNARVFSYMANLPAVRERLQKDGLDIPQEVVFIGAMHDTTRDEIEFYDEEKLTSGQKDNHHINEVVFGKALSLNAKERSRRFDTVNTKKPIRKLHEEVKKRSVSLFEPRPELNHATNSLCIVGRGVLTKNVFLDRRAFMNSYDYRVDPEGKHLLSILNAAAPVCGGINLEYYFSRVDNEKLGAGTKLPHNVMGLFGVANGVDGDLRPGLPSQMVEVHDPIRLMFVVEHYPEVVLKTIKLNPATYEWFINEWVYLAVKDPGSEKIYRFVDGQFREYQPLRASLQKVGDTNSFIENYLENIPVLITD
ncbi:hypothetical protein GCM10009122_59540 [Fulvivirga kasyanovii]|uniref:Probable inorganic carbon transporter subunit DabA n=1 Tax=Fulvivirga kasyanovii TaxID=396812 RepID=A0ABW9RTT3_9BACT|nr:DUF2309 domain-containing protein [Fulvivirga kasyanovii]MTI27609.1 DUF2309 domain-containing protein [Fulvivirga kasyanovii]